MAKVVIKDNDKINSYLRLKEKQLEINWNATGKIKCDIRKKGADFGSILTMVVTNKRFKSFYSACSLDEPYDSQYERVAMSFDMLEKSIHDKIIYLFFNYESKKS